MAVGALMASTAIVGRAAPADAAGVAPAAVVVSGADSPQAPHPRAKPFNIAAGTLAAAIAAFEQATGLTVVIDAARLQGTS